MSVATTIAPALNRVPRTAPAQRIEHTPPENRRAALVEPQHMQALARANRVRLARAALKREIAAGRRSATEVVRECPWEAESMTIAELLASQRRWGKARSRKLIVSTGLTEMKRLGTLTDRQRRLLAAALDEKFAAAC
ncbi:MAG TPA: hypothetical protein VHH72_06460 [Solirubrobacterales bacterium]|jgi:hypothetical protein|nr:hypothetical protein [Solirubrobacterales bacterium]